MFLIGCAVPTTTFGFYDPGIGRWISRDPIGERGGINVHAFVWNDPVGERDAFGLILGGYTGPKNPDLGNCGRDPRDLALELERKHFPDIHDPYGGGYRHCIAACLLRRCAGLIGDFCTWLWDRTQEDPNDPNSRGDMAAEKEGKKVANGKDTCEDGCLKKYPPLTGPPNQNSPNFQTPQP